MKLFRTEDCSKKCPVADDAVEWMKKGERHTYRHMIPFPLVYLKLKRALQVQCYPRSDTVQDLYCPYS